MQRAFPKCLIFTAITFVAFPLSSAAQSVACDELDGGNARHANRAIECVADLTKTLQALEARIGELESMEAKSMAVEAIPEGVVVASMTTCRELGESWTELEDARGRMILGANPNGTHQYERRPFRSTGGEEFVTLTVEQMPEHSHAIPMVTLNGASYSDVLDGLNAPYFDYRERSDVTIEIGASSRRNGVLPTGGSRPHNNMPPYIALYFCKKD